MFFISNLLSVDTDPIPLGCRRSAENYPSRKKISYIYILPPPHKFCQLQKVDKNIAFRFFRSEEGSRAEKPREQRRTMPVFTPKSEEEATAAGGGFFARFFPNSARNGKGAAFSGNAAPCLPVLPAFSGKRHTDGTK